MIDDNGLKLNRLILGVAGGHPDCLDGIYEIAGKRMFAMAYGLVGRDFAEDVIHDSLIKIARFAHKYRRDENPYGWILKLVRNTALDFLKSRKLHPSASTEEFYSLSDGNYAPDKRNDAIMLEQAMSKLDADERMAIYYKYFADMTVREIAAELKISKSSAARLTEKAEEKLKNLLYTGQNRE